MNGGYGQTSSSSSSAQSLGLQWNPKHLEIKTRSVEKTLEPLVIQVTTLVSSKNPPKKKGKSKRANVLVAAVEKATDNFVERGKNIAKENPDVQQEMLSAVEEVQRTGKMMSANAKEFAGDPCSSAKRGNMVRAARNLLSAVTRLLILADMIDVYMLLKKLRIVERDIEMLRTASSQDQLLERMKSFGFNTQDLLSQSAKRQQELKDPAMRDELAAARAVLRSHSAMVLTTGQAYVRYPELVEAKANRDFVLRQVCQAMSTISAVAQGDSPKKGGLQANFDGPGELSAALDDFDEAIMINPMNYDDSKHRRSLEERLEAIIQGAALMADTSGVGDARRERIVFECNSVRQALQDLLKEYESNAGKKQTGQLDHAIGHTCKKTRDLRRQLRKAVADNVSSAFLDAEGPLHLMIAAAQTGNEQDTRAQAKYFEDHALKMAESANLACSMSGNDDGAKMVRYASSLIINLHPQVVNAAFVLCARPRSKIAQENMDVFRDAWINQVRILTDAVDDIITVEDFLAVSENHILIDVNKCVAALKEGDLERMGFTAGSIRGHSDRICSIVAAEMDNYEPGVYTEQVLEAIRMMSSMVMPNFVDKVEGAMEALGSDPKGPVDENEFIDATRLVYDGIHEIRRAVLLNRTNDDLDSDTDDVSEKASSSGRPASIAGSIAGSVSGSTGFPDSKKEEIDFPDLPNEVAPTAREAMTKLPEEEKQKIAQQVEVFHVEKQKFDQEVSKWDDSGNDIIVLAKRMCMIMMEMTDFTRGKGPLHTTMAVINAAQRISEAGTKLDKLTRPIANQCPESSTKNDLLAYLERITLYCHQLNITSKVKADVTIVSGELIVSGLDSATSLIQAAKNLMAAVVLIVKASYVASTMYMRQQQQLAGPGKTVTPLIVWKMKVPAKKPLVRREVPDDSRAIVRRQSQKKVNNPAKMLSEFHGPEDLV